MPITQAFCNAFKLDLLAMTPHAPTDTYKIALFGPAARLSELTTTYSATGEVPENGDYVAGGQVLEGLMTRLDGRSACLTWKQNPRWARTSVAAAGALIYNASKGNRACAVLDFGGIVTSTNSMFEVELPPASATEALIRTT